MSAVVILLLAGCSGQPGQFVGEVDAPSDASAPEAPASNPLDALPGPHPDVSADWTVDDIWETGAAAAGCQQLGIDDYLLRLIDRPLATSAVDSDPAYLACGWVSGINAPIDAPIEFAAADYPYWDIYMGVVTPVPDGFIFGERRGYVGSLGLGDDSAFFMTEGLNGAGDFRGVVKTAQATYNFYVLRQTRDTSVSDDYYRQAVIGALTRMMETSPNVP